MGKCKKFGCTNDAPPEFEYCHLHFDIESNELGIPKDLIKAFRAKPDKARSPLCEQCINRPPYYKMVLANKVGRINESIPSVDFTNLTLLCDKCFAKQVRNYDAD